MRINLFDVVATEVENPSDMDDGIFGEDVIASGMDIDRCSPWLYLMESSLNVPGH